MDTVRMYQAHTIERYLEWIRWVYELRSDDDPYMYVHDEEIADIERCLDIVDLEYLANEYDGLISEMAMQKMSKNL